MTDYGHDVRLGLFPTPDAAFPQRAVDLAVLADTSGLDLVSIQDHPYNAGHLDTSTLLTWIAARTTRVRLSHNVANLPLRAPVVLARTIATLDLLSGGRADLGIGAGAFWDGIAAAGGPRRSPGEAVDALAEAIDIARQLWRGEGSVRAEGEHYRVRGLRSGPQPGGSPGIWVGAYGPRMLRVTGRLADGWLPSMGYLPPARLAEANARIDEAAVRAGRAPGDVVRLYNVHGTFGQTRGAGDGLHGHPEDWAEQLAGLVLEEGMSSFVLATDDPVTVRIFAEEVGPALRDLVDAGRAVDGDRDGVETAGGARSAPGAVTAPLEVGVRPTPDDGTRLTGELAWDEAARPRTPSPAGAPTAYTRQQLAAPQHLVDVHDHLRGELARVRDVVDQVRRGHLEVGQARSVINTMAMRQNNWTLGAFCESYCRIVTGHHTLEDRSVFPHLRRSEPGVGPVLDRLEEEHEVIADVLDRLDRALVGLVGQDAYGQAGSTALDELGRSVDLLTDTLLSHLSYEERELAGPLARHGLA
ncbi:LLM class flavin-dependent oxidoreductase [Ornithinimicrobium cerasi]|uniref:Hemerythrin HHE cation binding domain-containing protein n=1 Tax=Ornithinimicrobium cerasi TaxID=2248773 RepID=A0A285VBB3_9MICO|nr:LLM class flavin-dependent oxidoreductase [Ornithinimicrobium cerasi]SOC51350.1 Hemerythrin HHE cation binding domain-containing protein [Ornithinimicrobium cerasi]